VPEAKILIVDDEDHIRDMLRMALELHGFRCIEAENATIAHSLIVDEQPNLVLLDWMMPEVSGVELIKRLKKDSATKEVPIIMLTARADEDRKIHGLESGADDYVTKPFSNRELIARIESLLRRTGHGDEEKVLEFGVLQLNPSSHRVSIAGNTINVGPTEYKLLLFFMTHPDRVYSRAQVLDQVWGGNVYVEERTVDVHIRRLRKVLEQHSDVSSYVQTVRGAGYRFTPEAGN
jgi:two-component system phosphate regulon response regulator PhoB|tara:strand:+ start:7314 stop:8015 length:702 start_codon:yes stop_codon:yes gene_type:complete